jgi:hypothetical protein
MIDRLCGYCRDAGHNKSKCPLMDEQRHILLTHTPKQRQKLANRMLELGYGPGAMLTRHDGVSNPHLIVLEDWDKWISSTHFCETVNIRNTKRVRLTTYKVETDFEYRCVYVPCIQMNNGSGTLSSCAIYIGHKQDDNTFGHKRYEREELVAPVYESPIDPQLFIKNIDIPVRLRRNGERGSMQGIPPV